MNEVELVNWHLKSGSKPWVFDTFDFQMCFSPQRRALFPHRVAIESSNSGPKPRCFENVLRATTACTFSTWQLPKVLRCWGVLHIFTSKCASRHNGVHFFDITYAYLCHRTPVNHEHIWTCYLDACDETKKRNSTRFERQNSAVDQRWIVDGSSSVKVESYSDPSTFSIWFVEGCGWTPAAVSRGEGCPCSCRRPPQGLPWYNTQK